MIINWWSSTALWSHKLIILNFRVKEEHTNRESNILKQSGEFIISYYLQDHQHHLDQALPLSLWETKHHVKYKQFFNKFSNFRTTGTMTLQIFLFTCLSVFISFKFAQNIKRFPFCLLSLGERKNIDIWFQWITIYFTLYEIKLLNIPLSV